MRTEVVREVTKEKVGSLGNAWSWTGAGGLLQVGGGEAQ